MTNKLVRCGCDLVNIRHFQERYERSGLRLLERFLSSEEIKLASSRVETMAGFFAAKEAFAKALGTGLWAENALRFTDLTINRTELGAPFIIWEERVDNLVSTIFFPAPNSQEMVSGYILEQASVSISHDGEYAMAYVVMTLRREELENATGQE